MKLKSILLTSLIAGAGLALVTSCSEESRLAKSLPGEWSGAPQTITDNDALTASLIETVTVGQPTPADKNGGDLSVNGVVSATTQLVADSSFTEPVTVSVGAIASVSGTWKVIDDDEVVVSFDPSTLSVSVDPEARYFTNVMAGGEEGRARLDGMRAGFCDMIKASVTQALSHRYSGSRTLDDVKVKKGSVLKFEIGKTDYVYHAVPEN